FGRVDADRHGVLADERAGADAGGPLREVVVFHRVPHFDADVGLLRDLFQRDALPDAPPAKIRPERFLPTHWTGPPDGVRTRVLCRRRDERNARRVITPNTRFSLSNFGEGWRKDHSV